MFPSVEVYARQTDVLGEGPIWSVSEQALNWLDIASRRLYRRAPSDSISRVWELPEYAGCLAELDSTSVVLAMGASIQRLSLESGKACLLWSPPSQRPGTRFNDGKVDSRGRLWVGTMQNNFGPEGENLPVTRSVGSLYRFDPDGSCTVLEENIGVPNTLAWSPNGKQFYFADSVPSQLYAYDYEPGTGAIRNKRVLFGETGFGIPDGSAIDADGCLWNARWDGGVVLRITPHGVVDKRLPVPVPRPTSCIFGGPDFKTLFVTSARQGLTETRLEQFPLSGTVFAIHGAAQGFAVPPLAISTLGTHSSAS